MWGCSQRPRPWATGVSGTASSNLRRVCCQETTLDYVRMCVSLGLAPAIDAVAKRVATTVWAHLAVFSLHDTMRLGI